MKGVQAGESDEYIAGRAGLSHSDARGTAQWGAPGNAAEKRVSARPLDKCSIRPIYIASGAI